MKVNKETKKISLKKFIFSTNWTPDHCNCSPHRCRRPGRELPGCWHSPIFLLQYWFWIFDFKYFEKKILVSFQTSTFFLNFANFWIKGWQGKNRKIQFLYICSFTLFAGLQEWTWGDLQQSGESFHLCKSGLFCFHSDSSIVSIWIWLFIF